MIEHLLYSFNSLFIGVIGERKRVVLNGKDWLPAPCVSGRVAYNFQRSSLMHKREGEPANQQQ